MVNPANMLANLYVYIYICIHNYSFEMVKQFSHCVYCIGDVVTMLI